MERRIKRPDRTKIDRVAFKYWTRALTISSADLQKAIEKVGNSAVAVRKHLEDSARDQTATREQLAKSASDARSRAAIASEGPIRDALLLEARRCEAKISKLHSSS
jgi:predicted RNA-binding protein YlqC (UPF0109 family)